MANIDHLSATRPASRPASSRSIGGSLGSLAAHAVFIAAVAFAAAIVLGFVP
ncbi:hypothetical protein RB623_26705 [Mesorhizobium sp. LHD-90]|uniref:hypothetical protein n=1 Tax=Mesorhizobium sp. LHD-90 TaxID=3071414 RepID=UPI0027E0EC88|nr:hypothetical protein [Mesorhizobium sp. LHD-90]MDQ6437657.1 hypothetical protein [Mesorhizobium sp. LHD-90]